MQWVTLMTLLLIWNRLVDTLDIICHILNMYITLSVNISAYARSDRFFINGCSLPIKTTTALSYATSLRHQTASHIFIVLIETPQAADVASGVFKSSIICQHWVCRFLLLPHRRPKLCYFRFRGEIN